MSRGLVGQGTRWEGGGSGGGRGLARTHFFIRRFSGTFSLNLNERNFNADLHSHLARLKTHWLQY